MEVPVKRVIKYDLHIHSIYSDGTLSPYEIIDTAKKFGLKGISITDHDEIIEDDIKEYAKKNSIMFIPAIEFSSNIVNVHIIGYNININNQKLQFFLSHQREERKKAIKKMCEKSKKLNIPVDFEEVVYNAKHSKILGRPHIAQVMIKKGYVKSFYEAFQKYLKSNRPMFVDYKKLHYREIIELIKQAGGVSILAHPGLINFEIQDKIIADTIKSGIDGIEVFYPRHKISQSKKFYDISKNFGLLISGGSDFHGETKPDIKIGDSGLTEEEFSILHQHIFYRSSL